MIINPYLVQPSGPSYGTLTTAWIAATGETDLTIIGALNTLESDLTTYGLTSKMKALYPMVGGTAAKHKFNFMDARDLDAAYRLVFNGGWTHSSTGALPNGTNAYADTKLIPNILAQNSAHIGYYSRTASALINAALMGSFTNSRMYLMRFGSTSTYVGINSVGGPEPGSTSWQGFILGSRVNSSNARLFRNGSFVYNAAETSIIPEDIAPIYLGAWNRYGAGAFSNAQCALACIGDGLSDTEAANFYTAVQTFQTTLGRQVGVPIVSDSDAQAFLNAAVITDTTQASAVNTLVTGLKADGLWTKMKAIYPFVGGTATTHSYNLKNTAQYQLTFNGGWTHASTGILPNGTNAYANTGLVPNGILAQNSAAIGTYLRGGTPTSINSGISIGCSNAGYNQGLYLAYAWSAGSGLDFSRNNNNAGSASGTDNLSRGFLQNYRSNSTNMKILKNNLTPINNTNVTSGVANVNMYIGASNNNNVTEWYSDKEISFAFISDGYTDTEAANFYTRVQTYQTALSRNV